MKIYPISNFDKGIPVGFSPDGGNVRMTSDTSEALIFEGTGSGTIYLTNPGVDSSIESTASFVIPAGASFIEFNYKSDLPFYVGLQSNLSSLVSSAPYYLTGVYPSDHWQKFYLKLSDYVAEYPGSSYNFYIKVSLPADSMPGRLLIDNVQLVSF